MGKVVLTPAIDHLSAIYGSCFFFLLVSEPANYAVCGASFFFQNGHHLLSWDQAILILNSGSMTNQHVVADGSMRDGACQMIAV